MLLSAAAIVRTVVSGTVYTVDTDSSATYGNPLHIENATVTVDDGTSVTEKPFMELVGSFVTNSVFRKRGEGYLRSSPLMKTFTGEVRIEEGGWMVVTNGCLGATAKAWAPTVVISNGASLVVCPTLATCPCYDKSDRTRGGFLRMYNPMTFEGEGYENRGAICVDSEVSTQANGFSGNWTLTGDAVIGLYTKPYAACTSLRYCYLNGHQLHFQCKGPRGLFIMPQAFITGGIASRVILDGTSCRMEDTNYQWWNGGSDCEFVLTNAATLGYYNFDTEPYWTLIAHKDSKMSVSGTEKYSGTLDSSTKHYDTWGGPVILADGTMSLIGEASKRGANFLSTVSGPGGFFARDLYLQLFKPDNSFEGSVAVTKWNSYGDPGIAVHCNGALPDNIPFLAVTNAPVYLGAAENFALPRMNSMATKANVTNRVFGNATEAAFASLYKYGAGTLKMEVPFSVTGRTEIAAGTLVLPRRTNTTARLYSAAPGLWRGISPNGTGHAKTDSVVYSNQVEGAFEMLSQKTYPPWVKNCPAIWGGYVWNRSPTNETWTFAVSVRAAGRVYVDGVGFDANDDYAAVRLDNKVMAPGAHTFRFSVLPREYGSPGHGVPGTSKGYYWKDNFGIAIDRFGRKSKNCEDYEFPMNDMAVTNAFGVPIVGGDGSLFTRDNIDTNEVDAFELAWQKREALFRDLILAPGAAIDLSGEDDGIEDAPLVVRKFQGCGSILNGSLAMMGKWTLDASQKDSWPMTVDGDLSFLEGAAIDCDIEDLSILSDYPIATVGGRIDGLPELSAAMKAAKWSVRIDPDNSRRLLLCPKDRPFHVIIR